MLTAKNAYEAVDTYRGRDFLLLFRAHQINIAGFTVYTSSTARLSADQFSALLGLEARAEESLISDLRSLMCLQKDINGKLCLHLYHKSFSDFLEDESRAKDLFVPEARVYTHLAKCFMQQIIDCRLDFDSGA